MKAYRLIRVDAEIRVKPSGWKSTRPEHFKTCVSSGCTLCQDGDLYDDELKRFSDLDAAKEALSKLNPSVRYHRDSVGWWASITEYFIEHGEVDEDDEDEYFEGGNYDDYGAWDRVEITGLPSWARDDREEDEEDD